MQTSRDRILTTHTGSLPRPAELRALLVKKDQGEPYDEAELARVTREAVTALDRKVSQQMEQARTFALNSPLPTAETALDHAFA